MKVANAILGAALLLLVSALAPAGRTQGLPTLHPETAMQIGHVVAARGDADGDGVPDVAFGTLPYISPSPRGRVVVRSGATGAVLWASEGEYVGDGFGAALAWGGDVDGDGRSDLLVGAPDADFGGFETGRVYVLSGVSGSAIRTWDGDLLDEELGSAVAGGGDIDGDAVPDVVAGAAYAAPSGISNAGLAKIFSGATGATLYSFAGSAAGDRLGGSVAVPGDVDGDGHAEFAIGAYGVDVGGSNAGQVRLFSGATGTAIHTWNGPASEGLGEPVAAGGDVNADGTPDLIAAGRFAGSHAGIVRVFSGASGAQLLSWTGPGPYTYWGTSVDGAGDVNGDGFDDVIVGSPQVTGGGSYIGMARVYSGASGAILISWQGIPGGYTSDAVGSAVAGAGDLDADGHDDVLVGNATGGGLYPPIGQVPARSGATGGVMFDWLGLPQNLRFGRSVDGVGDVDGDGVADLVVGGPGPELSNGPGGTGTARVYSGATGNPIFVWTGTVQSAFGTSVAGCGDVNGDGEPDVLVGAPAPNFATVPQATVFSGADGSTLLNWVGALATGLGEAVAGAGDVDGDGVPDVAVGAPWAGPSWSGEVRIFSGQSGGLIRSLPGTGGYFGRALANAGDVDDDGTPDLLVGAPYQPAGGASAGQARAFSGATGALLYSWNGASPNAGFGTAVAGGGDVDGDGRPDLAVGAPAGYSNGPGQTFVFLGAIGAILFVRSGWSLGDGFGSSVALDGDANGDGWADLAVGAPSASNGSRAFTGQVLLFGGPQGNLLETVTPASGESFFGASVAYAGRIDPGACDDLIVGAPYYGLSGNGTATLRAAGVGGPAGYTDLGYALAGTGGVAPQLRGYGFLQAGNTVTLVARHALAGAFGILAIGASAANAPILGGVLVPQPDVFVPGFSANAAGVATFAPFVPTPYLPTGTTIYAQAAFLDPGAPQAVCFTNGLSIVSP